MRVLRLLLAVRSSSLGVAEWTQPSAAALQLQAGLDAAIRSAASTFTIPPGDYDFGSAAFNISDAHGLRIRALGGPRLLFALGGAVIVQRATDSMLQGPLTIDYNEEPASQVTVRRVGSGCFSTSTPPQVCLSLIHI